MPVSDATASAPPLAAYSFDAGEGEVAEDLAGEHDGEIEGATWTKGRYGSALSFDGENDCVTVADASDLDLGEELTLEAWVKPRSLSDLPILYKDSGGDPAYGLMIGVHTFGNPEGLIGEDPEEFETVIGPEDMEENVWSHLAFTFDGADMRLYLNGELVAIEFSPPPMTGEGSLSIGCNHLSPENFEGLIDEVRVYDRALGAEEVVADSKSGIGVPSHAPLAAYSFDAGEGEVAEDLAGEHDGEIEGATWTKGRYGSALSFDGENDCVTVADASDLDLGEELTLEAWVKPRSLSDLPILYKDSGGDPAYGLMIGVHTFGNPEGLIGEDPEEFETVIGPEDMEEDVWSHLAFTFDEAHMRLYLNGELVETEPQSDGPMTGEGSLSIGCNHLSPENFEGLIDEVRVYDRALDVEEVLADSRTGIEAPSHAPLAAYSFDAGEGEVAEDLAGEHDGEIEGATWTKGRYGSALSFDGENDCVTIADASDLDLGEELTLEAWVKPRSLSDLPILLKDSGGDTAYALAIGVHTFGNPEGMIGEDPEEVETVIGPEDAERDVWSHLAFTYDGAQMRLYLNGELVETEPQSDGPMTGEGSLSIGCNHLSPENFEGLIDEVRVYDRALDASELAVDKATPVQTPPSPPVAAYSFDAGEGEVAEDLAGEHDGTLKSTEWVKGKYGSAIFLDGNNDYVEIPHSADLTMAEEFTLEAWVRPDGFDNEGVVISKKSGSHYSYQLYGASREEGGVPEGFLGYDTEPFAWEDVEDDENPLQPKIWNHLALTFDGAELRLYVNGELVDTESSDPALTGEGPLIIGGNDDDEDFQGRIDEIRVYERALDVGEIAADGATPIQTPQTAPIAAYSFDAGEGEVAEDLAGEHDGTLKSTEWVKGKYGSAIFLDGNNDYAEIPHSPELALGEEFTLSAWVRPDGFDNEGVVISKKSGSHYSYQLYGASREEGGVPEGFLGYDDEPFTWEDVEDDENPLQPKIWNHLALTFDGAELRLYVNGELVDTEFSPPALTGEGPLIIGGNDDDEDFQGRIDEVRVYERALDAKEVRPDVAPPSPPSDLEAVIEPEEGETEVSWNPSTDPPFSDGYPGSGVRDYSFRYRPNGGSWSSWQSTAGTSFGIPETEEGESIKVKVFATDASGNISPLRVVDLVSLPTSVTPEDVGVEEANEGGNARLYPEPAYLGEMFEEEENPSAFLSFEEKLCGPSSPCGKYNGRAAAAYATKWNLIGMDRVEAFQNRNHNFDYFGGNGGDCTNYVSQALYNGGLRFMRANGVNDPNANDPEVRDEFERGNRSWWSYYFLVPAGPYDFRHYKVTESWVRADVLREQLLQTEIGRVVQPKERLKAGDVIFYNLDGLDMSDANHSQIVVRVGKNRVWVAQHSPGYRQTLRRVLNRNDEPGHKLHEDWTWQAVRPVHTAANIQD